MRRVRNSRGEHHGTRLGAALLQSLGSRAVRFLRSLAGMFSGELRTERPSAFLIWAAPAELGCWLGGRDLPVDLCCVGGQTPEAGSKGVDFYLLHRWRAFTFLVEHVVRAVEAQHDGLVRRRTDRRAHLQTWTFCTVCGVDAERSRQTV